MYYQILILGILNIIWCGVIESSGNYIGVVTDYVYLPIINW